MTACVVVRQKFLKVWTGPSNSSLIFEKPSKISNFESPEEVRHSMNMGGEGFRFTE